MLMAVHTFCRKVYSLYESAFQLPCVEIGKLQSFYRDFKKCCKSQYVTLSPTFYQEVINKETHIVKEV